MSEPAVICWRAQVAWEVTSWAVPISDRSLPCTPIMHVKRVTLTSKKNWWMGPSLSAPQRRCSCNPSSRTRPGGQRVHRLLLLLRRDERRARRWSLPPRRRKGYQVAQPVHTRIQTTPPPHFHLLLSHSNRILCAPKHHREPCSMCTGIRLRPLQVRRQETRRRTA